MPPTPRACWARTATDCGCVGIRLPVEEHVHGILNAGVMDDFLDDAGRAAIGQTLVAAIVLIDELLVVEAELMQQRGLKIVGRDDVFDGVVADFVGRPKVMPPRKPPPASHIEKPWPL